MRTTIITLGLVLIFGRAALGTSDSTRITLDLWPGKAPGEVESTGEEQAKTETRPDGTTVIASLTNVSKPSASWPKRCEEWLRDTGVLKLDGER